MEQLKCPNCGGNINPRKMKCEYCGTTFKQDPNQYNLLENSIMGAKKRYFASSNANINEDEFLDWNKPIVHVEGEIERLRVVRPDYRF